jgi:YD repeat-containing protein
MARTAGDYTAARLAQWLHGPGGTQTSSVIENVKEPLESKRTFYTYADQPSPQFTGSYGQPTGVARVTENGNSEIYQYEYNARGRQTKVIDPLGRETVYVYGNNNVPDANPTTGEGIDLLQVKRKNGAVYDTLASTPITPSTCR